MEQFHATEYLTRLPMVKHIIMLLVKAVWMARLYWLSLNQRSKDVIWRDETSSFIIVGRDNSKGGFFISEKMLVTQALDERACVSYIS